MVGREPLSNYHFYAPPPVQPLACASTPRALTVYETAEIAHPLVLPPQKCTARLLGASMAFLSDVPNWHDSCLASIIPTLAVRLFESA